MPDNIRLCSQTECGHAHDVEEFLWSVSHGMAARLENDFGDVLITQSVGLCMMTKIYDKNI